MASQKDVRAIALSLPGVSEEEGRFAFSLEHGGKQHGIVWAWRERIHPRKPKVPRDDVVVLPVADQDDKAALLAADEEKFFTEPHYDGYPAVLVRLPAVSRGELRALITEAYRCAVAKAGTGRGRALRGRGRKRRHRLRSPRPARGRPG